MERMAHGTGRVAGMALGIAVVALGATATLTAAPPKKTTWWSVSTTAACNLVAGNPACAPDSGGLTGIMGDGGPYVGDTTTLVGSFIYEAGGFADLKLLLSATVGPRRYLHFDFTAPDGTAPCARTDTCKMTSTRLAVNETAFNSSSFRPGTVDAKGTFTPLPGGMFAMDYVSEYDVNMAFHFYYNGVYFTLRFLPALHPGSCQLKGMRTGLKAWEFYTGSCDSAGLVESKTGSTTRQVDEGLFHMPFKMTVVMP
jgi:hypothetical protein